MTADVQSPGPAPIPRPDPWVERFAGLVRPGGGVLDLACGAGRHTRLFLARGHRVAAIDRSLAGIADLAGMDGLEAIKADLEDGSPWPLGTRSFDAIIVVNYLHRPLMGAIEGALAPGGVLIYRTFARGNERYGKPSNPDFLLTPNELIETFAGLEIVAFEAGDTGTAIIQRMCAIKRDSRRDPRRDGAAPPPLPPA